MHGTLKKNLFLLSLGNKPGYIKHGLSLSESFARDRALPDNQYSLPVQASIG